MEVKPFTISEVSAYITRIFQSEPVLRPVVVQGEISSIGFDKRDNMYISLSDGRNKLDCVLFAGDRNEVSESIEKGQEIVVAGKIESYPPQSKYSLIIREMEIAGAGELAASFEKMKAKLSKEGLFDPEHKKEIPEFPRHIGIVTSGTGAAAKDILKILREKDSPVEITLFSTLVQGSGAAKDISDMIVMINEELGDQIDVLIVGRGGGSEEDLAAFNDEYLARTIYNSEIPIISAVGHEINTSISDLVADVRAETPTAAANMVAYGREELREMIDSAMEDLNYVISNNILRMDLLISNLKGRMEMDIKEKIHRNELEIEKLMISLKENDPRTVLKKGYGLVTDLDGVPVCDIRGVEVGKDYNITFENGLARVKALDVKEKR